MCHLFDKSHKDVEKSPSETNFTCTRILPKTDSEHNIVQIVPFNPTSSSNSRAEVAVIKLKVGAGDRGGLLACHGHSQELEVTWQQLGGEGVDGIGVGKSGSVISIE